MNASYLRSFEFARIYGWDYEHSLSMYTHTAKDYFREAKPP